MFIIPMGQSDVNLASGKHEIPFAIPFAVRDIIFGIPTNQITLAFDESRDTDELKTIIEFIQISNISLRNYLINTESEQSEFFKCIKNAHSTYQATTNVIFGSVSTAEMILAKIQEYDLISRKTLYIFHWSVFPVSEKFQSTILEAMRIAVFTEHRKGTFRIYYNQAKSDGENELTLVNWWNQDKGLFRIPVFPSAANTFNNFGGRNFLVPVLHKPPWNFVNYENGTFNTDGGRDDQLLKLLASKLNFRFEYFDPPERIQGLGIAVNGTFRGVLGLIGRREAPFFLGDVTITYERLQIVDFSSPTLGDCGTFATHSPRLLNEALAIVRPFHWQVWLPVTVTALLSGPVLFTVIVTPSAWRKRRSKIKASKLLQDCIWFSVGMFLKQSVKEPSRMHKVRLLMILLSIIATYVIGGLYSATLTSLLARPAREKPIRTLFDLEEAMKNKGYQLLVEKHSSSLSILKNGTGIYGRLWRAMRDSDVLVDSVEEGMRRVQDVSSMAAIFAGRETLFFDARRFGAHHFYLGDCLFTRYSAIAMQMGSPFLENFDQLTIRLFEAGILTKMTRDEYERLRQKVDKVNGIRVENEEESDMDSAEDKIFKTSDHNVRSYSNDEASGMKRYSKNSQGSTGGNDGERKSMKAVSIKMLQGPFYVLLIGYSISCLVLYGERVVTNHQKCLVRDGDHHFHNARSSCFLTKIPFWKWAKSLKKFWQRSSKEGTDTRKPANVKGRKSFLSSGRVRFSYHE